jgi:ABC-type branched-subunit amino acid transport system ATPase component
MFLQIAHLRRSFHGKPVLNGVNLEAVSGELLGVIGPNGSGKTTLVNVCTGVYPADSGRISVDGTDITNRPLNRIASFGVVRTFQITRPLRKLTVRQNLQVPLVARLLPDEGKIEGMAVRIGLRHKLDTLAEELSGGQKKLLEIARAAIVKPRVAFLDEPFAGVHPETKLNIQQLVKEMASAGTLVVLVDHDLSSLFAVTKRVAVLASGVVIAEGSPAAIAEDRTVIDRYLGTKPI